MVWCPQIRPAGWRGAIFASIHRRPIVCREVPSHQGKNVHLIPRHSARTCKIPPEWACLLVQSTASLQRFALVVTRVLRNVLASRQADAWHDANTLHDSNPRKSQLTPVAILSPEQGALAYTANVLSFLVAIEQHQAALCRRAVGQPIIKTTS